MSELICLSNRFLVAMPTLQDPFFSKSVVYLFEHSIKGAMGVVINKALPITLENLLHHLNIKAVSEEVAHLSVLIGGPVSQEQGFVLHSTPAPVQKQGGPDVLLSTSKDCLQDIAEGHGPDHFVVALGYAAWQEGQLEEELARNDWLVVPFDQAVLFSTPLEQRWQAAADIMGIDILQLSGHVGHA